MSVEEKVLTKDEFLHFRVFGAGGVLSKGGATVYYRPDEKHAYVTVSVCAPVDNYSKRDGRERVVKKLRADIARGEGTGVPLMSYPLMNRRQLFKTAERLVVQRWTTIREQRGEVIDGVPQLHSHQLKVSK